MAKSAQTKECFELAPSLCKITKLSKFLRGQATFSTLSILAKGGSLVYSSFSNLSIFPKSPSREILTPQESLKTVPFRECSRARE